jgi:hypothetical protein
VQQVGVTFYTRRQVHSVAELADRTLPSPYSVLWHRLLQIGVQHFEGIRWLPLQGISSPQPLGLTCRWRPNADPKHRCLHTINKSSYPKSLRTPSALLWPDAIPHKCVLKDIRLEPVCNILEPQHGHCSYVAERSSAVDNLAALLLRVLNS